VGERQTQETSPTLVDFLVELRVWINQLIGIPHDIFAFSLTEKGNLLSQWRAYTPLGDAGVSIGFSKRSAGKCSDAKRFRANKVRIRQGRTIRHFEHCVRGNNC